MYLTLFLTFLKIGVGTIGGGYAMLPLIQREVVDRGWLSKEDFIDLFSVAQSLPGIFAVNISIFVGYKLKKSMGSVVCALGTILPSFLIILLIATFFTRVQDNEWVTSRRRGADRRALYHYGTFHQTELSHDAYSRCSRVADLDRRRFAGMDHPGCHCRRVGIWFKDKEKLI